MGRDSKIQNTHRAKAFPMHLPFNSITIDNHKSNKPKVKQIFKKGVVVIIILSTRILNI